MTPSLFVLRSTPRPIDLCPIFVRTSQHLSTRPSRPRKARRMQSPYCSICSFYRTQRNHVAVEPVAICNFDPFRRETPKLRSVIQIHSAVKHLNPDLFDPLSADSFRLSSAVYFVVRRSSLLQTDPVFVALRLIPPLIRGSSPIQQSPHAHFNSVSFRLYHGHFQKVISSQSTALVVTPGTSWLLDSTCCNHLTFDMSLLSSHIPIQSLPPIHYADGLGFSNGINDCHHSFFTDPSTNLFPTPNSPPNTTPCPPLTSESTQSRTTSVLPNLSSAPCEEPEHAPVRRSIRVRETPHLKEYRCFSIIMSLDEPSSYKEANTNPLWQQAMDDELQALAKTHT
ncbi:retrotransposon protein [Cucumis melo var. makuwa]|uniref:Retrotransposon protein n=1 Tax=Cucumis melo var. makuwa TaxID=1194695 RepID=A0A5A7SPH6_CUCMM|nr:retrotransposon protein [Cucumis melo var. makuwa]